MCNIYTDWKKLACLTHFEKRMSGSYFFWKILIREFFCSFRDLHLYLLLVSPFLPDRHERHVRLFVAVIFPTLGPSLTAFDVFCFCFCDAWVFLSLGNLDPFLQPWACLDLWCQGSVVLGSFVRTMATWVFGPHHIRRLVDECAYKDSSNGT